jgi:hypothetical protein
MSDFDQVDVHQLADGGAVLDQEDMQALLTGTADERIRRPAAAWLQAYRLARWLGFKESTALNQASAAWDRAVEDLAVETMIAVAEVN